MSNEKKQNVRIAENAPKVYQVFNEEEENWITKKLNNISSLIDVGCGDGRLALYLSSFTDKYVGIDLDSKAISKAKKLENKKRKFQVLDITKMSEVFPENCFEISVCLYNTIGNIEEDKKAIKEMYKITSKKCFITGIKKGNLNERINYYESFNLKYRIDKKNEIFYSDGWGISRAYHTDEIKTMCEKVGFTVMEIINLGEIAFGIELKK